MKRSLAQGFTLVELLIVIVLLGVIAVVVITAINPIEVINKANDTQFKADAEQLSSAIERYYTNNQSFPWQTVTPGTYTGPTLSFGFVAASDQNVGVCGATCGTNGVLITTDELKSGFRARTTITGGASGTGQKLMVGKDAGTSASVYACYTPSSKSNRDAACTSGTVYTLSSSGVRTPVACTVGATWVTSGANAWTTCVPQ